VHWLIFIFLEFLSLYVPGTEKRVKVYSLLFQKGKNQFSTVVKSISKGKVLKINFHGGKNQFSSPVTPANFCVRYACTGNTLIWLAGIRGKTCHGTSFTANASQSNESVVCARVAGTEVCGCHGGRKLIFTTVEINFYHGGNWFLLPWKTNF